MAGFNPALGSTDVKVLLDNATRLDKLVNGPAESVPDRAGEPLYSWREIQRNITAAGLPYMSLSDAQADIQNIPNGRAVWVRNPDGSSLADEYINNNGTLTATGRKMPAVPENINPLRYTAFDKSEWMLARISADNYLIYGVRASDGYFCARGISIGDASLSESDLKALVEKADSLDGLEYLSIDELQRAGFIRATMSKDRVLMYGVKSDTGNFAVSGLDIGSLTLSESKLSDIINLAGWIRLTSPDEFNKSFLMNGVLSSDRMVITGRTNEGIIDQHGVMSVSGYDKSGLRYAELDSEYKPISTRGMNEESIRYQPFIKDGFLYAWDSVKRDNIKITDSSDGEASSLAIGESESTFVLDGYDDVIANMFIFDHKTGEYHSKFTRRNKIAIWGHSFTSSSPMPSRLNQLCGDAWRVYTFGRGGGKSSGIARRQGAIETRRKLSVSAIPADTSDFNLSPNFPGPHAMVNQISTDNGHAFINGVLCFIEWNASGASSVSGIRYHARRMSPGDAVPIPDGVNVQVEWYPETTAVTSNLSTNGVIVPAGTYLKQHSECINVLWIGRNSLPNQSQILSDLKAMVDKIERSTVNPKIVIMPEFPTSSEVRGSPGWSQVYSINRAYKQLYPQYYCEIDGVDALKNFKQHYNPAYAQDVTDISLDITPTSLRDDNLHPSTVMRDNALYIGAYVNAEFIYQFISKKGWI